MPPARSARSKLPHFEVSKVLIEIRQGCVAANKHGDNLTIFIAEFAQGGSRLAGFQKAIQPGKGEAGAGAGNNAGAAKFQALLERLFCCYFDNAIGGGGPVEADFLEFGCRTNTRHRFVWRAHGANDRDFARTTPEVPRRAKQCASSAQSRNKDCNLPLRLLPYLRRQPFFVGLGIGLVFILRWVEVPFLAAQFFAQDLKSFEQRITTKVLPNGLTLIICERPEAPVFSYTTFVDAGDVNDPSGESGLAHMFEHLAFKGTSEIGTTDYAAEKVALAKVEAANDAYEAEYLKPWAATRRSWPS
jgi:hypothetical protein